MMFGMLSQDQKSKYYEGLGYDALFSRHGGVVECRWISLGQGKYMGYILKRFEMMDYKAMTTPMALNLKVLSDDSLEAVDATMYH